MRARNNRKKEKNCQQERRKKSDRSILTETVAGQT